jgi:hypothetical protein
VWEARVSTRFGDSHGTKKVAVHQKKSRFTEAKKVTVPDIRSLNRHGLSRGFKRWMVQVEEGGEVHAGVIRVDASGGI